MSFALRVPRLLHSNSRTIALVRTGHLCRAFHVPSRFINYPQRQVESSLYKGIKDQIRLICHSSKDTSAEDYVFGEMSVQDLSKLLEDTEKAKEVQFVDVREPWEVDRCSLPLFETYPLQSLLGGATGDLTSQKTTVVLCHHGVRSRTAAAFLKVEGFEDVFNVTGGIDAYASLVDPSIGKY